MQVVIVPAWRRPEFLWACLQRLLVADREDLRYLLALDRGHTHETARIASVFRKRLGVNRVDTSVRRHAYKGNSYNVLEAYREAANRPSSSARVELVHLIEEDILIGADYFDYHDRAHALTPDTFAVTACRNQKYPPGVEPPADPEAVYRYPHCQSLGLSFRPDMVRSFLRHATRGYYHNPGLYCRVHFPDSEIHPGHHEQDGLINRVRRPPRLPCRILRLQPRRRLDRRGGPDADRGQGRAAARAGRRGHEPARQPAPRPASHPTGPGQAPGDPRH
jgi:hypothetical protein